MDFVRNFQNNCRMAVFHQRLPRYVALAALLFYGLTLNWGTTLNSLPLASKVAGWDWVADLGKPAPVNSGGPQPETSNIQHPPAIS